MSRSLALIPIVLIALLAGCDGQNSPTTAGPNADADSSAPAEASGSESNAVPDACALMTAARLGALLGVDPGSGEPRSVSPDRSVCFYSTGVITAVEIAANYEASRRIIEDNGSTTTDIAGVGTAAFYDSNGQVIAKGEKYFVGVTAVVPADRLTDAARELLAAAESAG
jgi:hypothetical protein